MVGNCGDRAERLGPVVARARALPALIRELADTSEEKRVLDAASHQIEQRRAAALVGNMLGLDAGHPVEQHCAQLCSRPRSAPTPPPMPPRSSTTTG